MFEMAYRTPLAGECGFRGLVVWERLYRFTLAGECPLCGAGAP